MSVANNNPANQQLVLDANYIVTVALPIAATTANTNALDLLNPVGTSQTSGIVDPLGSGGPFPATRYVICQLLNSASAGSANNKNVNVVLQHADPYAANGLVNSSSYVNIPQFANPLLKAVDSSGNTPANSVNVMLPPDVKRFIRAQATGEANGGNAADATLTLQLLF